MAPSTTWNPEKEDKSRDAAFSKVMHGQAKQRGGLASMLGKDAASKKEALDNTSSIGTIRVLRSRPRRLEKLEEMNMPLSLDSMLHLLFY